jgi:hypothetical protein
LLDAASNVPSALMNAASAQQDMLCRTFGFTLSGPPIDRELGNMIGVPAPFGDKLFSYVRYAFDLTSAGLTELHLGHLKAEKLQDLAAVEAMDDLAAVGKAVSAQVQRMHYEPFLLA